jgi:hypothetical protein
MAEIMPACRSRSHHLRAPLFELHQANKHEGIARRQTNVGRLKPKHLRRRPVEGGDHKAPANNDNRNIDRVKDVDDIGSNQVRSSVAI